MGRKKKQDIIVIEEKGEKIVEEKKIEDKGKLCSLNKLIRVFFYDTNRKQLSRTATMNFIFFACAVALIIIAIVMGCMGKTLPNNLFAYVGGLCGGGFLQYSYAKTIAPNIQPTIPPNTNTTTNTTNQPKGVQ